jgi:hypothetical protein
VELTASNIKVMAAVSTSETSVNIYQTTRRNIPEDSHLESLKELHVLKSSGRMGKA